MEIGLFTSESAALKLGSIDITHIFLEIGLFSAEEERCAYIAYGHTEFFKKVHLFHHIRGHLPNMEILERPFRQLLPISKAKYTDLLSLCQPMPIPTIYHNFYTSLPHDGEERDNDDCQCSGESEG